MRLKVAIIEDHIIVADMVKSILVQMDEIENVLQFSDENIDLFYELLNKEKFDLLIVDIFIGKVNGLELIEKVRQKFPKKSLKILVLSSSLSHNILRNALNYGVNGYLSKLDRVVDFKSAILHIFNSDRPFYSNRVKDEMLTSLQTQQRELTPREIQLLLLVLKAKTPKEMAYELNISINTVNYFLKKIMKKMGVSRIPDLIIKAISEGYNIN